jgi:hypothetical protein
MKLSTVTIPSVEMTREDENRMWREPWKHFIEGKQIHDWNMDDGHNQLKLVGEDFYRVVVIKS